MAAVVESLDPAWSVRRSSAPPVPWTLGAASCGPSIGLRGRWLRRCPAVTPHPAPSRPHTPAGHDVVGPSDTDRGEPGQRGNGGVERPDFPSDRCGATSSFIAVNAGRIRASDGPGRRPPGPRRPVVVRATARPCASVYQGPSMRARVGTTGDQAAWPPRAWIHVPSTRAAGLMLWSPGSATRFTVGDARFSVHRDVRHDDLGHRLPHAVSPTPPPRGPGGPADCDGIDPDVPTPAPLDVIRPVGPTPLPGVCLTGPARRRDRGHPSSQTACDLPGLRPNGRHRRPPGSGVRPRLVRPLVRLVRPARSARKRWSSTRRDVARSGCSAASSSSASSPGPRPNPCARSSSSSPSRRRSSELPARSTRSSTDLRAEHRLEQGPARVGRRGVLAGRAGEHWTMRETASPLRPGEQVGVHPPLGDSQDPSTTSAATPCTSARPVASSGRRPAQRFVGRPAGPHRPRARDQAATCDSAAARPGRARGTRRPPVASATRSAAWGPCGSGRSRRRSDPLVEPAQRSPVPFGSFTNARAPRRISSDPSPRARPAVSSPRRLRRRRAASCSAAAGQLLGDGVRRRRVRNARPGSDRSVERLPHDELTVGIGSQPTADVE